MRGARQRLGQAIAWLARRSRRAKWLIGTLVVAAFLGLGTYLGAQPVADWLIGKVYQNVVPPEGSEMAVTVTSYPPSSHVASIVGGGGEGLNCSIPALAKLFFPRAIVPNRSTTATHLFRQACVFHDMCYRHGLATYGYSQNDCDQMLQEHAARICTNVGGDECQLNAKKVLAGVTNGGFDAYQSWRTSTYYEFDPTPSSSERMSVARVIDHPFKAADPAATRDEPDQLLLTFDVTRSNTTVACRNCNDRKFSAAELRAAGLLETKASVTAEATGSAVAVRTADVSEQAVKKALEDLVRPRFTQQRPVGLPSAGIHAAPRVLTAGNGEQFVVWVNRRRPENTVSCVIIADPKNLLTHTRSRDLNCLPRDSQRMRLAAADMYASAPQPGLVALPEVDGVRKVGLVGTGLYMSEGLRICLSTDLRTSLPKRQKPKCFPLHSPDGASIAAELGAFQNFPIIKGERHIYLARRVFNVPEKEQVAGVGQALVLDVGHRFLPPGNGEESPAIRLHRGPKFNIPDDYDPMLPLTQDADLRLLSVRTESGKTRLYEIDLDADEPKPVPIDTVVGASGTKLDLDASWARRPILVLDQPGEPAKTQLVLSRSLVTTSAASGDALDSLRLEFMVLERDKSASGASALKQARGLACNVIYTLQGANPAQPCRRSAHQVGAKRPSPAHMLQGGQLLVGRLTSPGQKELDLAMPDTCYPNRPIILQPLAVDDAPASGGMEVVPDLRVARDGRAPLREILCGPLSDAQQIAGAMTAPK
jgi:hypothetical protein